MKMKRALVLTAIAAAGVTGVLAISTVPSVSRMALAATPTGPVYSNVSNTMYVSATGTNTFACTQTSPCPVSVAWSTLKGQALLGASYNVVALAGTYTSAATDMFAQMVAMPGLLSLTGTMSAVTPATGTASGTSTASAANTFPTKSTVTDSGQTWTTNNLRGYYVRLGTVDTVHPDGTLGTWPIASNTSTALTLETGVCPSFNSRGSCVKGLGGAVAYSIVKPGTILTDSKTMALANALDAGVPSGSVSGLDTLPVSYTSQTGSSSSPMFAPYVLDINTGGMVARQNVFIQNIDFAPTADAVLGIDILRLSKGAGVVINNCTFHGVVSGSGNISHGIFADGSNEITIIRSVFASDMTGFVVGVRDGATLNMLRANSVLVLNGGILDAVGYIDWFESVYTDAMPATNAARPFYFECIKSGYIAASTITSVAPFDSVFFENRGLTNLCNSNVIFDAITWNVATSNAAILAPGIRIRFDPSGVASTGLVRQAGHAPIAIQKGAYVTMSKTAGWGLYNDAGYIAEFVTGSGVYAGMDDINDAGSSQTLCNRYTGMDGCISDSLVAY